MGMFDYIKCKAKLPLNEELNNLPIDWGDVSFQTKDLENCLLDYTISKSGKLIENIKKYEHVYFSKEEIKEKKLKPWDFVKESKLISDTSETINFHGKITFGEILDFSEDEDIWVDFEAYFIYGKLDRIDLLKVEKYKSRKKAQKNFFEKIKEEEKTLTHKIKKMVRKLGWNQVWKSISCAFYKISGFFSHLASYINRYLIF